MIIIIGTHIPTRIRGVLKIWLLEVKPSVFVGDVNKVIESRIMTFITPYLTDNTDIMVIRNGIKNSIQGFIIDYPYNVDQKLTIINGLQLITKRHND